MRSPTEEDRRKPGACGSPVLLADGRHWLLAHPRFRPRGDGLTSPPVDRPLDRVFGCAVLGEAVDLTDIWEAARELLRRNYDLSEGEAAHLLCVSAGREAEELAEAVVLALFGGDTGEKTFTRWARASMLANGLGSADLSARDLTDVLAVLVETNRTVPLTRFADACKRFDELLQLELLV